MWISKMIIIDCNSNRFNMEKTKRRILKYGYIIAVLLFLSTCMAGCSVGRNYNEMKSIEYYPLEIGDAQQMVPNAYNLGMAKEKGIANKNIYDGKYLEVQAAYMALLNYYLCDKVELNKYQKELDENELSFPANEETIYAKAGAFGRKNIFIRNNVYVERLTEEQLSLLQENMDNGKLVITEELLAMVEETLEEVISVRYEDSNKVFDAVYEGGVFQTNIAPNNALVLVISYDYEYDEEGNIQNDDNEDKKDKVVENLQEQMSKEIQKKIDIPVCVFY